MADPALSRVVPALPADLDLVLGLVADAVLGGVGATGARHCTSR